MSHRVLLVCAVTLSTTVCFSQDDESPRHRSRWSSQTSPREAVYERAALKASQRQDRMAARKWLGYEPLRPAVSSLAAINGMNGWIAHRRLGSRAPSVIYLQAKRDPGSRTTKLRPPQFAAAERQSRDILSR